MGKLPYTKKIAFFATTFFCFTSTSLAALPPDARKIGDLDVMVRFIKEHRSVAATLKSIDMKEYTIHFGVNQECIAYFGRKLSFNPLNMPGPGPGLKFIKSNCDLGDSFSIPSD